jgi:DNA mismatch repair protein MutS
VRRVGQVLRLLGWRRTLEELRSNVRAAVPTGEASVTPMMRQYQEMKARAPDAFLFFRLGDFYELFFDDAVRAAEILQITLTARSKGPERVPMCGVPFHAARRHVARLLDAGHKVAICDQVETPGSSPGLVRREVVRVVTPGMVLDEEVLDASRPSWLAAVAVEKGRWGAALLDASTGDFRAAEGEAWARLLEWLAVAAPRELLVAEGAPAELLEVLQRGLPGIPVSVAGPDAFHPARAAAFLRAHFEVAALDGFGLGPTTCATAAAGAALRYLKETQRTDAAHVTALRLEPLGSTLVLDAVTQANLELVRTLHDGGRKGTLLGVLDVTATSLGARKLSSWLLAPLRSLPDIEARLDAVEELAAKSVWRETWTGLLRQVADVERLGGRLAVGVGNARDLAALGRSLQVFPQLVQQLSACQAALWKGLAAPLGSHGELQALLARAVAEEPPPTLDEGGMFRPGYSQELDALVALSTAGKSTLAGVERRERERTGIQSLKVRYNRVFGYFLEVTRSNLHLVPPDWERRQTMVGAERFVTPELKTWEEQVLTAEERRCALERKLFEELRARVLRELSELKASADAVAAADALLAFARCAAEYGYVRPQLEASGTLEILGGRHPVVERLLHSEPFVPNDVRLVRESAQVLILTGPNMAGKSTLMRQVALITLLAQAGSFVPARRARIGLVDRIFTRVGASDNVAGGQSTFMVEMAETAAILHHATRESLVVLDEIGRGTSTYDGLSIAWAVAEHLHDRIGCRTLFATHYHELTDLALEKPRVRNASMAVQEVGGRVVFLRALVEGGASRSYGIEVARLAGLPLTVVRRAREVLGNLEAGELDAAGHPRAAYRTGRPVEQLPLLVPEAGGQGAELLERLLQLHLDGLTPLQALNLLAELQAKARESAASPG